MANVISDVFKEELLKGNHDFDGGATYKIALFTSSKTVSVSDPTSYNTTNQISGTNYTAGGNTLANPAVGRTGSTSFVDFDDTSWTTATFTARYAQIYQSSGGAASGNNSVLVLDFGGDFTATAGTFTIQFPANDSSNAILSLS